MAPTVRMIEIDGQVLSVPRHVTRTASGWQARVRGLPSQHFADAHYGDARGALDAAGRVASALSVKKMQASPADGKAHQVRT